MPALNLRSLPPWALYGGAGVGLGGAYLIYKRRKAATPAATPAAPVTAYGADQQQSGVVPYYLRANDDQTSTQPRPGVPLPVPVGVPGGGNVEPPAGLPSIPPILPPAPAPVPPSPPAPVPFTPPPTPAPTPAVSQNLPADVLAKIQAGGENIVGSLRDPVTGGTWWLGSYGGLFNAGGARFLGSARNYGFGPGLRTAMGITPLGTGYRITSTHGEVYDFPG